MDASWRKCASVLSGRTASRIPLAKVNVNLVCVLCGGYLIDATTINKCLHSFCRSCILRRLKVANRCPVCLCPLNGSYPHKNLRSDRTLQRIVYKVVPGLYKRERDRRQQFSATSNKPVDRNRRRKIRVASNCVTRSWIHADDENVSVCLRLMSHLSILKTSPLGIPASLVWPNSSHYENILHRNKPREAISCRFVLCPVVVSIQLIKKFIRLKLSLDKESEVYLFYSNENLPDDYTLLDVLYVFKWPKNSPLLIDYLIVRADPPRDDLIAFHSQANADSAEQNEFLNSVKLSSKANTINSETGTAAIANRSSAVDNPLSGGASCGIGLEMPISCQNKQQNFDFSLFERSSRIQHDFLTNRRSDGENGISGRDLDSSRTAARSDVVQGTNCKQRQMSGLASDYLHPDSVASAEEVFLQQRSQERQPSIMTAVSEHRSNCSEGRMPFQPLPSSAPLLFSSLPPPPPPAFCLPSSGCLYPTIPLNAGGCYEVGVFPCDGATAFCGFQLIGLFSQALDDGSVVHFPDSSYSFLNSSAADHWSTTVPQPVDSSYEKCARLTTTPKAVDAVEGVYEKTPLKYSSAPETTVAVEDGFASETNHQGGFLSEQQVPPRGSAFQVISTDTTTFPTEPAYLTKLIGTDFAEDPAPFGLGAARLCSQDECGNGFLESCRLESNSETRDSVATDDRILANDRGLVDPSEQFSVKHDGSANLNVLPDYDASFGHVSVAMTSDKFTASWGGCEASRSVQRCCDVEEEDLPLPPNLYLTAVSSSVGSGVGLRSNSSIDSSTIQASNMSSSSLASVSQTDDVNGRPSFVERSFAEHEPSLTSTENHV